MPVDFRAFTIKAKKGRFRELVTKARVRQGAKTSRALNLPQNDVEVFVIRDTGATTTSSAGN